MMMLVGLYFVFLFSYFLLHFVLFLHLLSCVLLTFSCSFLLMKQCHYGLNVTNLQGDDWRAYGDNRYLDDANAASRVIVVDCVQASVNEIIHAMENGYDSETLRSSSYAAAQCVPTPKSSEGANLTPMFKWDATQNMLLRRKELNNLWGKEFKDHGGLTGWWSSTTLLDLESLYGPPPDLPPFPNRTRLEENVYL